MLAGFEMKVKFSRHARRRAKLYNIPESAIEQVIGEASLSDGENEIVSDVPGMTYPLKIVASVNGGVATIITNYPLKKRVAT
jgi:hypothetical protein